MNIYRRILELPEPDYARFNPSNSADGTEASFTGKLDENKIQFLFREETIRQLRFR